MLFINKYKTPVRFIKHRIPDFFLLSLFGLVCILTLKNIINRIGINSFGILFYVICIVQILIILQQNLFCWNSLRFHSEWNIRCLHNCPISFLCFREACSLRKDSKRKAAAIHKENGNKSDTCISLGICSKMSYGII